MDPLDLTLEQSYHETEMEIEHWCPVCDRLILPTPPPPAAPAGPAEDSNNKDANTTSPIPQTQTSTPTTPTAHAPPTPVHKRRSTPANTARLGGHGRPALNRSRTSTTTAGGAHGRKRPYSRTVSHPNLLQDLINEVAEAASLSNQNGGGGGAAPSTETAPRSKTSPMGNLSHSDNANDGEDRPAELRTTTVKAPGTDSDHHYHPSGSERREGARSAGVIKRKTSAPDVNVHANVHANAGVGPRLRPLTKSRLSGKPRPKSLNLVIAQELDFQGGGSPKTKTSKLLMSSPVEEQSTPVVPPASSVSKGKKHHAVQDVRRRLYCSEECYNIDLHGRTLDDARDYQHSPTTTTIAMNIATPAVPPPSSPSSKFQDYPTDIKPSSPTPRPFEVKRNLSCEMPWLWTSAVSPQNAGASERRMAPTRNPSWLDADTEDNGRDKGRQHRRVASVPLSPLSPLVPSPQSRAAATAAAAYPGQSPLEDGASHHQDEKSPHRLFFRRMPGKIDAAPAVMPPLFVVDGQWTETPPSGFDYPAFMAERERERQRRQIEITDGMLLKKSNGPVVADEAVDTVIKHQHDSARRKKKADVERSQYERKRRTVHAPLPAAAVGYSDTDGPHHHHHRRHSQPPHSQWWHLDEREDWKAYWAARESGEVQESVSWEMWQLRRHHERVSRVEKEEAHKRVEGERKRVQADIAAATAAVVQRRTSAQGVGLGDRKKVAKRPFLIRVASQPTTSDVDLVTDLYEESEQRMHWLKERQLQRAADAAAAATANTAATAAAAKERVPSRSSSSSEASPLGMNRPRALPALLLRENSVEAKSESGAGAATPSSFMRGHTLCIPGFVVEDKKDGSKSAPAGPDTPGFVFPLVGVPGSLEAAPKMVPGAAMSLPLRRLPPGLSLPASAFFDTAPTSTPNPDNLVLRPRLKKSSTLPIDPPNAQPAAPGPRRRVQSLKSLTLTVPEWPDNNNDAGDTKQPSLAIPRSPLGLHSFSAAEVPVTENRGRTATNTGRSGDASSVSRSSATCSRRRDSSSGNQRRLTLKPHVDLVTATAVMSPTHAYSSPRSPGLAQLGLPADLALSGSPEVVTAVSGVGSGSGSSGEESTWSRADVRPERNATLKITSKKNLSRIQRDLVFTKVRPNSVGPVEPTPAAVLAPARVEAANEPAAPSSSISYSASLLRYYSEFRSGSAPSVTKPPLSPSGITSTEKEPPVGRRRSLWGIFGSAKP